LKVYLKNKTMKRVYRIITSYTHEDTNEALKNFSDEFVEELMRFAESLMWCEFYDLKYDGKICHWSNGDMMVLKVSHLLKT